MTLVLEAPPLPDSDDEDPARQAGGAHDLDETFRALAPPVLGYLRSSGVPDPDDLLGEVFLVVATRLASFRGDAGARRRWVFTIAHHKVVDEHRRIHRRRRLRAESAVDTPPPAEPFDPALVAALAALTPEQREVVSLRFVADLSLETVASITGRSVGATKALQHRALEALSRHLGTEPRS
ncbi:MAG: polymerase, sigma-24 subunit, subfamily [Acidimicrobiales bacterium]|jgi:RNA polymerase sigma factor (sigma-70 family)|nr:polymerase, sigma-24 subunit, subfamily [Acidimicrobiales bacterium]